MAADPPNKHGLRRSDFTIPKKRLVRQRCGFGCVVCGYAVVQYHHFDPPFEDAKDHVPEGITLLCARCHDEVTRGLLPDEKVRRADANPHGKKTQPHQLLRLAPPVNLVFGSMVFLGGAGPWITIGDDALIHVGFTDDGDVLLNASFFDENGNPTVVVVESELQYCDGAWDIEIVGTSLKVRRGPGDIVFDAVLHPPHSIYVRTFDIARLGWTIKTDDHGTVQITTRPTTKKQGPSISSEGIVSTHNGVCIFGGPMLLEKSGKFTSAGGFMAGPFPASRLRRLALNGEIERLKWEVAEQPIIYVSPARDPRRPVPMVQPVRLPNGKDRYPIFCEVCNQAQAGTRDIEPGQALPATSGIMCSTCSALPPDAWKVMEATGKELTRFQDRNDAIQAARKLLAADKDKRVVVVGLEGEEPAFYFSDEPDVLTK